MGLEKISVWGGRKPEICVPSSPPSLIDGTEENMKKYDGIMKNM